jgi:hypothetical protein
MASTRRSIKQQAARLMLYNTFGFPPLLSSMIPTRVAQHTLLYHVVYYQEQLWNGHGRRPRKPFSIFEEGKKPLPLLMWVTLAALCLSIRVRIKIFDQRKKNVNWDILSGHDTPIFGAWQLTSREREKSRAVDSISRGMTIDYFFFVFRLLSLSSF